MKKMLCLGFMSGSFICLGQINIDSLSSPIFDHSRFTNSEGETHEARIYNVYYPNSQCKSCYFAYKDNPDILQIREYSIEGTLQMIGYWKIEYLAAEKIFWWQPSFTWLYFDNEGKLMSSKDY